jgi:glutamate-1-semialdehyde aminotransferase
VDRPFRIRWRPLGSAVFTHALNRGLLLTPFHNMALMCTSITQADVDTHTEVFGAAVSDLTS